MNTPDEPASAITTWLPVLATAVAAWAALQSAKAAKAAQETAAAQRSQARAFVAVESMWLDPERNVIGIYTRNFGQSPAYDVNLTTAAKICGLTLNPGQPTRHENGTMPPGFQKFQLIDIKGESRAALAEFLSDPKDELPFCEVDITIESRDDFGPLGKASQRYESYPGWGLDRYYPLYLNG